MIDKCLFPIVHRRYLPDDFFCLGLQINLFRLAVESAILRQRDFDGIRARAGRNSGIFDFETGAATFFVDSQPYFAIETVLPNDMNRQRLLRRL